MFDLYITEPAKSAAGALGSGDSQPLPLPQGGRADFENASDLTDAEINVFGNDLLRAWTRRFLPRVAYRYGRAKPAKPYPIDRQKCRSITQRPATGFGRKGHV